MKILFTLHNFFPERIYGAENVCIQQMRELLRRGHEVALFYACNKPVSDAQLSENGLKGLRLFRVKFLNTRAQVLLSAWKPHITRQFAKAVDQFAPDSIIFHHLVRLSLDLPFVGWRRKIPTILYLHDFYLICPMYSLLRANGDICADTNVSVCARCLYENGIQHGMISGHSFRLLSGLRFAAIPFLMLRNQLRLGLGKRVDVFISPSEFLIREMKRRGAVVGRSRVIPNGGGTASPPEKLVSGSSVRFGYLGNIIRKKGIEVLVRAFRGRLGEHLTIRGFTDIIEAFNNGKTVICSDLGGMSEMVRHNAWGLVCTPGDPEDLRSKAIHLLKHPSEAERLASSLPRWPSISENVSALLETVDTICSDRACR
ncbi:MAG: hypothetical protein B6245_22150 [Desulfobacteraceae bacterium 4572_88]|nr:MAG: hypothetical protein B6245_22150 [Desulfobacteraceae bacterium 4572_88]